MPGGPGEEEELPEQSSSGGLEDHLKPSSLWLPVSARSSQNWFTWLICIAIGNAQQFPLGAGAQSF